MFSEPTPAFHYIVELVDEDHDQPQLLAVLPSFQLGQSLCERRERCPLLFVEQWPGGWQARGRQVTYQVRLLIVPTEGTENVEETVGAEDPAKSLGDW